MHRRPDDVYRSLGIYIALSFWTINNASDTRTITQLRHELCVTRVSSAIPILIVTEVHGVYEFIDKFIGK